MAKILHLPIPEETRKQVLRLNFERAREAFAEHKSNPIDAYSQATYFRLRRAMNEALAALNGFE
jgi:hypothetical protein